MTDITSADLLRLVILALPVAAISWTVTHEEFLRELHDYCVDRSTGQFQLCRSQILLPVYV